MQNISQAGRLVCDQVLCSIRTCISEGTHIGQKKKNKIKKKETREINEWGNGEKEEAGGRN